MIKYISCTLLIFSMLFIQYSEAQTSTINKASKSQIESSTNEMIKSLLIPGLSIAVSQNGKLLYSGGFGYADVKNKVPANENTLFRMASVSKLFAAGAIAKLMQEGKLDINAPIENYIQDYPNAGKGVTTKRLLSHQAGIRHYGKGDLFNDMKNFESTDEALKIFIDDPLESVPGTKYKYSTYAFTLIQAIVEATSDKDYLSFLNDELFVPLEMTRSFPDKKKVEYENNSTLYKVNNKGKVKTALYDNPSYKWGGGGMLSSAVDLVKFGEAHIAAGFYEAATLDSMFSPAIEMPGTLISTEVGMAWRISKDEKENVIYHHAGNMNGARSFLMLSPSDNTVIAVMSNNRQLDFIEHFALAIRDCVTSTENISSQTNYEICNVESGEVKGSLSIMKKDLFSTVSINIDEIFEAPVDINMIEMKSVRGVAFKNLQVGQKVLYAKIDVSPTSAENNLLLFYKNAEGNWTKKEYIIKAIS